MTRAAATFTTEEDLEELVEEQFRQSRQFFEQPLQQKNEILVDGNKRGFTPMGEETLSAGSESNAGTQTEGDTKEGLTIGHEVAAILADGIPDSPVHLAGAETLTARYALAFDDIGLACRRHAADLAARGLALIAETLP